MIDLRPHCPRRRGPRARIAPAVALAAALAGTARAAETQWWITDSPADHAKSETRGIVVRPDGVLELGPRSEQIRDDSLSVVWSICVLGDGSVALAGDRGRVDRWTESGGIRPWVKLPSGQVLALAPAGDGVVAGTAPDGLVYRIGARGDTTLLARTGERYVWGLAPAPGNAWYAATGTRGRLLRLDGKSVRVLLDSDESNLLSLVPDGRGGAFAGGDSRGRVFHVTESGALRTVFDATEDEVRALALGSDGALYAAGLSASAVSEEGGEPGAERPAPVRSAVSAGKATVYRVVPDSVTAAFWSSPQPFVFALAATREGVLAATGNRAGLYRIERPAGATQLLLAPQGQVTALAAGREGRVFAATSNPAALWRIGPERAARGELTSTSLDAHRIARFGRIRWRGEAGGGKVEIETRSGNSDPPDTTWSPWRGGPVPPEGARIESPSARFLQWRISLSGARARVESVEAAWREQNLAPSIDDVVVAPQGQGFREGELTPRGESVTQALPGGQKVEYSLQPPASPRSLRELPMWARGLRTVQWRASDPNGDPLRYQVHVRRADEGDWIKVDEDLEASAFTWDTSPLPDGRYRLRVTASDAAGNPLGEERTAEAFSEPFTVDNTPPAVTAFAARGEAGAVAVEGRAEDGMSPLSRIEVALDEDDWRTVTPEGGLADDRTLSFRARLPKVQPGDHTVSVRAVDLAGNSAIRASRVTVPAAR
ncbi:MAG TPA: hypothetical protein VGK89_03710 [Candidatus Eisenbacteria bacterium]